MFQITASDNRNRSSVPDKYFVITNNEIVRVRYLLVFGKIEKLPLTASTLPHPNPIVSWILHHKSLAAIICYAVLLLGIGLSNSRNGYYVRQFFWKIFQYIGNELKRLTSTEDL